MLVFLSDVHLTDGSSGTTIVPRAFNKFCGILHNILGDDPAKDHITKIEIVLLGDIFDVIRSDFWLRPENNDPRRPIRPWSEKTDLDSAQPEGWNLEKYTEEIVGRIVNHAGNKEAVGYLKKFQDQCAAKGVKVVLSYLMGNHDWLINRYASTRKMIVDFLGIEPAQHYIDNPFPLIHLFDEYSVLARHGDYYDPFNYEKSRDASSLGDAIVIDLLSKFPVEVKKDPLLGGNQELINQLKEIDNVRPLLEVPAWIQGICNRNPGVEERVHLIWNNLVDEFFQLEFVRAHDRWGPDVVDLLEMALRLTSSFSFARLQEILSHWAIRKMVSKSDDYRRFAYNEWALTKNQARYVVYGHTHYTEQVPLDTVPLPGNETLEKVYFNTGTWRKVFEHTAFDEESFEFIGWHVLTFVIFYLEAEKDKDRKYEVWSASLGLARD